MDITLPPKDRLRRHHDESARAAILIDRPQLGDGGNKHAISADGHRYRRSTL
jgi:hypothetical protein